ncbi:MAG: helix-turn-helix transcriptional regulator [Acutalibacteraceae bacterium]|nr:helix-turn-helix transcriptional regulator [Acutalibacteraceae bacterium]
MELLKIGQFISERRKSLGLTQLKLAEKLNVTDRAVSKWERGKSLPDSSIMLKLCDLLKITVNDLLSGEVVMADNYTKELENKIIEMAKQKEESDKRLLTLEVVIGVLSLIILFVPIFLAAFLPIADWLRVVLIFSGFIPAMVGFHFTMRIEQTAGYYECKACHHKYVPTIKAVYAAPHMGRTRYMRCPECNKKTWQKKVISK